MGWRWLVSVLVLATSVTATPSFSSSSSSSSSSSISSRWSIELDESVVEEGVIPSSSISSSSLDADVVWNSLLPSSSSNYLNAMPLGNGVLTLMTWTAVTDADRTTPRTLRHAAQLNSKLPSLHDDFANSSSHTRRPTTLRRSSLNKHTDKQHRHNDPQHESEREMETEKIHAVDGEPSISLLLSSADAFSESGDLFKSGFLQLSFSPAPFINVSNSSSSTSTFRQVLDLETGTVTFTLGDPNTDKAALQVIVYVQAITVDELTNYDDDSNPPPHSVFVNVSSLTNSTFEMEVTITPIRTTTSSTQPMWECDSFDISTDSLETLPPVSNSSSSLPAVALFHRNTNAHYYSSVLRALNLSPLLTDSTLANYDPIINRTFGFAVTGFDTAPSDDDEGGDDDEDDVEKTKRKKWREQVGGDPFVIRSSTSLLSASPSTSFTVLLTHRTQQTSTVDVFTQALRSQLDRVTASNSMAMSPTYERHVQIWSEFWNRSYIEISTSSSSSSSAMSSKSVDDAADSDDDDRSGDEEDDEGMVVSLQYKRWRYTQAIQSLAPFALKFNGMLFTALKPPNVDYRFMGGLNWWQNSRLGYYHLLTAGDAKDRLRSIFELFRRQLPFAQKKTQLYFNFENEADGDDDDGSLAAAFWDEYNSMMGTTHPDSYGCGRAGSTNPPIWYAEDQWNHYNYQGALDLSLLILDQFAYTQNTTLLRRYLPIVASVVSFYAQRFGAVDEEGHTVIYPTQSIETWQCPNYPPDPNVCSTNDMPTVAGLHAVVSRLVSLDPSLSTSAQRFQWQHFLKRLPLLPLQRVNNNTQDMLIPCAKCPPTTTNNENADLYAVHPYRLYSVGRLHAPSSSLPSLSPALLAFAERMFPADVGWNQDSMEAALLGLAENAASLVFARASVDVADGYRFPTFMPALHDYAPSLDELAVMSNAIHYMLLQPADDDKTQSMVVLPAWPCRWDVRFKLHGPRQTVVEGELVNGVIVRWQVTPTERGAQVIVLPCQRQ